MYKPLETLLFDDMQTDYPITMVCIHCDKPVLFKMGRGKNEFIAKCPTCGWVRHSTDYQ